MTTCSHLDTIMVLDLPESVAGCEDCLREGGVWLHLRICLECGHVGCCDDSPNRHATAHHKSAQALQRACNSFLGRLLAQPERRANLAGGFPLEIAEKNDGPVCLGQFARPH